MSDKIINPLFDAALIAGAPVGSSQLCPPLKAERSVIMVYEDDYSALRLRVKELEGERDRARNERDAADQKVGDWTGKPCEKCKGAGEDDDRHRCSQCGGTGDQWMTWQARAEQAEAQNRMLVDGLTEYVVLAAVDIGMGRVDYWKCQCCLQTSRISELHVKHAPDCLLAERSEASPKEGQ